MPNDTTLASIGGRPFRINPMSISWGFQVKTSVTNTVGGKVVQILGVSLGDMNVNGSFGVGGWREQQGFLADMQSIAARAVADPGADPTRFIWPSRGWDFAVYLKNFTTPDGGGSVALDNTIFAPKWGLTLFIVEDNVDLKTTAENIYMRRLAAGLGWAPNQYNGPLTPQEVQAWLTSVGATSVADAFTKAGSTVVPEPAASGG